MTLSVTARYRDRNGDWNTLPLAYHVAGVETTRHSFYGSEVAIGAGLVLFPRLLDEPMLDLYGAELAELKREVLIMWDLLEEHSRAHWEERLGNILDAIELASPYGDDGNVIIG
ncbi:hypothetical protein [Massilia aquatica]|uniref:Uncharacterized protein n=1 Tax=Massilia aquatica TaxID=2609000 RepID=A0ABX0M3E7_9BURK|nr:hypothetical protein [Massilia aquatica]NHZ41705.1 hypothetical protein [Massilia aquatica]